MNSTRSTIIIVDDNPTNLTAGKNILKMFHQVVPVSSAAAMFDALERVEPDLILLDIEMPEMNGYEAIKKLKNDPTHSETPVIFLTAKDDASDELDGLDLGAVDYITKPFSSPLLLKRITRELEIVSQKKELLKTQADLKDHLAIVENQVQEKAGVIFTLQNAILTNVADLVELRDGYTGGHILRTRLYMRAMIDEMVKQGAYHDEIKDWDVEEVLSSAKLHDVGKITIPDNILKKPGRLDPEEFELMKEHVIAGVDAIEKVMKDTYETDFMQHALCIIGTHHEKWDGSGYPIGLKGKNIPLEGRLMAIADVYDALISVRPYKKALTHDEASKIIEDGGGRHFDPELVKIFTAIKDKFESIKDCQA